MLSILNELTFQKELQNFVKKIIMCFGPFGQKSKTSTTTKQKIKHINPCQSRESNLRPFCT